MINLAFLSYTSTNFTTFHDHDDYFISIRHAYTVLLLPVLTPHILVADNASCYLLLMAQRRCDPIMPIISCTCMIFAFRSRNGI